MKVLDIVVNVLLIVGAINLGLVGLFEFNLVGTIFGEASAFAKTKDMVFFNFEGITPQIFGLMQFGHHLHSSIDVWVVWDKYHSDLLYDIDLAGEKTIQGYSCRLCLSEYKEYYPTRLEMLRKHSFETFLLWCNKKLSESKWIELCSVEGHWSEATLLKDKNDFHMKTKYEQEGCSCQLVNVMQS